MLSGADYPIKSNVQIDEALSSTDASRIDHWHNKYPSRHRRYKRYFFHDWSSPLNRVLNGLSRRLSGILPDRSLPRGMKPYFGSQWWTLNHKGAEAVLNFLDRRPDVMCFMQYVHIPDEMLFQTILKNVRQEIMLKRSPLRYIDWSASTSHPKVLGFKDLNDLRQSECLFARKFDEREVPGIIEALEEMRT